MSFLFWSGQSFAGEKEISNASNLDNYVRYFYRRYSKHFDSFGLGYASPSYGVSYKRPRTAREWLALASYYKYRALDEDKARKILRGAIFSAYQEMAVNGSYKGFAASEANFLAVRMMEAVPGLIDEGVKADILNYIAEHLKEAVMVYDNENRQFIAAAHWQYINNYLFEGGIISLEEKEKIDDILKNSIEREFFKCVSYDYWYFENEFKSFSPHYQAISGLMMLIYGELAEERYYIDVAREMYYNLKKISFRNGMVEARLGERPIGLGAQFYLAMALLGNYFGDDDYRVYLFFGSGTRFFSDKKYPYRLEFHSTIEGSEPEFHDDYAFSDVAELGLIRSEWRNIDLRYKFYFSEPIARSVDETFRIINDGRVIIFNDKKNVLGSYGNWSWLYSYK